MLFSKIVSFGRNVIGEGVLIEHTRSYNKILYILFFVVMAVELILPQRVLIASRLLGHQPILMALVDEVVVKPPFRKEPFNDYQTEYKTMRILSVPVTAYSSTKDQTDSTPFITARNTMVRDGVVASNFLRFGTRVRLPQVFGDKVFIVEDRMNTRYWERIDVWMKDRQLARNFGYKRLKIEIVEQI